MPHHERNMRIIFFLILPVLGFLLGWGTNQKRVSQSHESTAQIEQIEENNNIINELKGRKKLRDPKDVDMSLFWEVWNTLEANFIYTDKLTTKEQINGAAKGLTDSLDDPYTVFMTPEETKEFEDSIHGEFEGIGAEVAIKKKLLTIVAPLKGSPAELAGLLPGDQILAVNEESTADMSIIQAITKIRGPRGEKVVLTIYRKEKEEPFDVTIVRDKIITTNLDWEMKDNIAFITIHQFGTGTAAEFQAAVSDITLEKPEGIILDLRNNGGGIFDDCLKVLDTLFDEEVVVMIRERNSATTKEFVSTKGGAFADLPLVVLINEGSASASEIVAGAVKDHARGLLLGEKTFGKGSVQNTIPFSNGSSLKVTIAEWLTPNKHSLNEKGVHPHEVIERTLDDFDNDRDPVLDRATDIIGTDIMRDVIANYEEPEEEIK